MTHRLLPTSELLPELVEGHLDRGDLSPEQLLQKLRPTQSSDLCGLPLRDQALGEPMNGSSEPHFGCELGRGLPQGREDGGRKVENDLGHRRSSFTRRVPQLEPAASCSPSIGRATPPPGRLPSRLKE